jgi:branched-chain amino acid transport system permease protein
MMQLGKLTKYFKNEVYSVPTRMLALIFLILLFLIPFVTDQPHVLRLLIMINIFAIFAASWDLISAYTGQTVLGHALFFGVGAYTCAILNTMFGWSPVATIPVGAIVAVGMGLIAGFPALRMKGIYLGLTTMAMPVVLVAVIEYFRDFTGGEQGIIGIEQLVSNRVHFYYVSLVIMVVSIAVLLKITRSKVGLIFQAIRDDEIAARASGVNTTYYKLLSFSLSGLFAGLAGGVYAHFMRVIGPSVLDFSFSFEPIIWTIFGGGASIIGPVVGVFVLLPIVEMLQTYLGNNATLIYYLILVVVVIFAPGGILRWVTKYLEKTCPRCMAVNAVSRKQCRNCSAPLTGEEDEDAVSGTSVKAMPR